MGFVHQISTLCLVQFDSCFFDAMLSLLTKLFPLKLDLQVANELFNWCYLNVDVELEFAFVMWKM